MVPFFPFDLGVSLLKQNTRKKGTLIMKRLLGNRVYIYIYIHIGFRVKGGRDLTPCDPKL